MEEVVRVQDSGTIEPDALIDALKALANPVRLEIVQWLRDPEVAFADYEPIADRAEVACGAGTAGLRATGRGGRLASTDPVGVSDPGGEGLAEGCRIGLGEVDLVVDPVEGEGQRLRGVTVVDVVDEEDLHLLRHEWATFHEESVPERESAPDLHHSDAFRRTGSNQLARKG